ncbi:MAG: hypothetical protein ABJH05_07565 [Fulvivirga sp.]
MNIVRSWREQKVMLKWRFPMLKDQDFEYKEGQKESMLSHLAKTINKTKAELELLFAEMQRF